MILDLNPAHNQIQDLQLRHEAIAINIEAVYLIKMKSIEKEESQRDITERDISRINFN